MRYLIIIILCLFMLFCLCTNSMSREYLEPEGCVIVTVYSGGITTTYGYITEGELELYKGGKLISPLFVQHPFEVDRGIYIDPLTIKTITVGDYHTPHEL